MEAPDLNLDLRGVRATRKHRVVLDGVDLTVASGEIRLLVGSSGAGKTTLLRIVAGLEAPEGGCVLLDGLLASSPRQILIPPHRRSLAMTFQDDALWPHLSVRDHLTFGRRRNAYQNDELERLLDFVGLTGRCHAKPGELSGGERQMLSLARALALHPRILLLDEPLAHVDLRSRRRLARGLVAYLSERSIATLWVTHYPEELSFIEGEASWLTGSKLEGPYRATDLQRMLEAD